MANDAVRAHFDGLSGKYGRHFSDRRTGKAFEFTSRAAIVQGAVRHARGRLLDCACGSGDISALVLEAGSFDHATLIDISRPMLDLACQRVERTRAAVPVAYVQSDIFEYPGAADGKFDVILCLGLIAHTGNLEKLLRHLKSMLSATGIIVLQTSVASHPGVAIVRRVTARRYAAREGYRLSYFTLPDVDVACRSAGLAMAGFTRYCFGLPFGDALWPWANYWVERSMRGLAASRGAEAICVLEYGT